MKFLICRKISFQFTKVARFIWIHQAEIAGPNEGQSVSPKPAETPLAEMKLSVQDLVNAVVKTEQTPGTSVYHMSGNEYLIMHTLLGDQVTAGDKNISFRDLMSEKPEGGKTAREKIQISLESLKKVALKHPAEYAKFGNAIENLVTKKYGAEKAQLARKHIEASQKVVATHTQEMLETAEDALLKAERIEYTVKTGDTLSDIGKDHGIPRMQDLLYFHNTIAGHNSKVAKISNIHAIKVGQKIMIPKSTGFALQPAIQAARKLTEQQHHGALGTLEQAEFKGAKRESARIGMQLRRIKEETQKAGSHLTAEQKTEINLRVHTAEAALAAGETAEAIQLLQSMMGTDGKIGALAALEHDRRNLSYQTDTSIFKHVPILSRITYSTESGILSFFDKNNSWEKAYTNLSEEDQILYSSKKPFEDLKNYTDPETADDYNFGSKLMRTLLLTAAGNAVSIPSSILISSALTGNPTLVVTAYVGHFDLGLGRHEIVSTPEAQLQPLGQFLFYTGEIKKLKEELPQKKKAIGKANSKDRPALEAEYKHLESVLSDHLGRLQMLINGIELEKAERLKEALSKNYQIERDKDGKITKISRTAPLEDRPNDADLTMLRLLEPKDAQEYSGLIKEFRAAEAEHKENTSDNEKQKKMSQSWAKVVEFLHRTIEGNTQKITSFRKAKPEELPKLLEEQKQARLDLKKAIEANDTAKIKELSTKLKNPAFIDRRSIPQRLKEAEKLIERSAQTRDIKREAITGALAQNNDSVLTALRADEKTVQARRHAKKQAEDTYISGQQIREELGDQFSDLARHPFVDFFLSDIKISHTKIAEAKAKLQPKVDKKTAERDKVVRDFMRGSPLENYQEYLAKKDYPAEKEIHQRHLNLYQLQEGGQAYDPTRESTNYLVVLSCLLGERATHDDRQALIHLEGNVYQTTMSDLENAYEDYYLKPKQKGHDPVKSRGVAIGKSHIMEGPKATALDRKLHTEAGIQAENYEPIKDILLQDIFPIFEAAGVQNIRQDLPKLEEYLTKNPDQKKRLVSATERLFYASRNYQTVKIDRELSQLQQKQKVYEDFDRELSTTEQGETTVKKALETIKEDEKLDTVITLLAETDIPNEAELRKDANELGKILEASKPIHKDLVDLGNLDQDARISPQVVPLFRSVYAKMQALHAPAQAAIHAIYESVYQKKVYDSAEFRQTHLAEIQKMFAELQAEHQKLRTELNRPAPEVRREKVATKRQNVAEGAQIIRDTKSDRNESIADVFQPHLAELLGPDISIHQYSEIKDIIEKGLKTVIGPIKNPKAPQANKDLNDPREVMMNLICERINSLGEKTVPVPMTPDMFRNPDGTFDPVGAAKTYEILNRISKFDAKSDKEVWDKFKTMIECPDYSFKLKPHDTPATTAPYQMANKDLSDGTPARYINMIMMQLPGVNNKQAMRETMLRTLSELGLHIDEVQLMQAMSKAKPVAPGELQLETINTGNLSSDIPYYPLDSNPNARFKLDGGYKLEFPRKAHIQEIITTDNKRITIDKDVEVTYNIYLRGKCFNVNIPRQDLLKAVAKVTRNEEIIPPEAELAGINITTEVPGTTPIFVPVWGTSIGGGKTEINKTEGVEVEPIDTPNPGSGGPSNPPPPPTQ